jgi:hypothetical protein
MRAHHITAISGPAQVNHPQVRDRDGAATGRFLSTVRGFQEIAVENGGF